MAQFARSRWKAKRGGLPLGALLTLAAYLTSWSTLRHTDHGAENSAPLRAGMSKIRGRQWTQYDGRRRPQASASILQLKDRFKKSLSMSGEVGSLAGDRVVSHERSRPADLSRRHRLCSRNAGSYPSHYCGCFSRCALLAYGHRCRNAVTARNVNSIDASERGQSVAPTTSFSLWMIQPCGRGECPKFGVGAGW